MSTSAVVELRPAKAAKYRSPDPKEVKNAPRSVETPIGNLTFVKGMPTDETARILDDNLDLLHGVDAFLKNFSGVSLYRLFKAQRRLGSVGTGKFRIFSGPPAQQLRLARASGFDGWCFIDLEKEGATIIDLPPDLLGGVFDMWFRLVGDLGPAAGDGKRGGKYLLLPPRQQFELPSDCRILRPKSHRVWLFLRTLRPHRNRNDFDRAVEEFGIRSLAEDREARDIELADGTKLARGGVGLNDADFFEDLNRLIQAEPFGAIDRSSHHLLASIGIVKGKPFRPTLRMKRILRDASAIGSATVRSITQKKPLPGTFLRNQNYGTGTVMSPELKPRNANTML